MVSLHCLIVVIFFFLRPSIVISRSGKGFPEKSFVPVTGNSPLYPFIAGNETHLGVCSSHIVYVLFVCCMFVCMFVHLPFLDSVRIILLLENYLPCCYADTSARKSILLYQGHVCTANV